MSGWHASLRSMKRGLLALLIAPVLLAPVRLENAAPSFFQPSISPAPEAYSLPPAEPMVTPTVVYVSPTLYPEAMGVPSSTLNLPLSQPPQAQSPVVIQKVYMAPPEDLMPDQRAALCLRSLLLVQDISMLSYQQKESKGAFSLAAAATAAVGPVSQRKWPNMSAFRNAARDLPWFYPNKAELSQAIAAADSLCARRQ